MKEIIKNNIINYELIRIRQNTPVLEHLKKYNYSFRLKQVSPELLEQLKNSDHLIDMKYGNFIAGYGRLKSESFRSSGGLKISDSKENILGSFIIEEKRIIYDAFQPFYKERDSYVYMYGTEFYTDMSMLDVLKEELNRKRQYLIYMGEKVNGCKSESQFHEVSKEELLEYAQNREKGEYSLKKRRYY